MIPCPTWADQAFIKYIQQDFKHFSWSVLCGNHGIVMCWGDRGQCISVRAVRERCSLDRRGMGDRMRGAGVNGQLNPTLVSYLNHTIMGRDMLPCCMAYFRVWIECNFYLLSLHNHFIWISVNVWKYFHTSGLKLVVTAACTGHHAIQIKT